ncbi:methionyl-tRNA synthetase [Gonapodya prolifera JEL478]|uniref:methionine--tRNA ligase n=1 Tax=Gonapodya prolifera (strain JEL478) TaxID=1344416 RepID=A0A139ANQ0_GONPJ|nr:methionyl-tRNA synthetase [Gonapodya prolifera JEL478]|eukprot:KXS18387.1 methionyl-tRNA synthetase [Gonapodya prolifera JEL478]
MLNRLPQTDKRNVLITSALPYVNNVPHLGNIIGSVLSADVFARYCRTRGYNTLYICGTDEYGTATETKALEENVTEEELCAKYRALHKQTYDWFNIDFDYFGKTTTPAQTEICQDMFKKLQKSGYTFEDTMKQLYCDQPGHKRFLADRFVEGECPHCHYDDARGDQCDSCGKLLNPTELLKPRCKLDGATPILKETKHQFLDLPKLESWNLEWAERVTEEGKWSPNGKTITLSWLKKGLEPRCITRDLKWGVPVPLAGYEDKVFYVWYDAPIGYISITMNYTPEGWQEWWKNPENVKLYQFMGKDNVPFHSVIFPCILHGTGDPYTIVNTISTCEYLNYENGKFSKSRGVGVFGNNVMASNIPVEVWRYYLLASRPETSDSQFLWRDFVQRNNNELLANLGNFVNRALKFVAAKYQSTVPSVGTVGTEESDFLKDVNNLLGQYVESMEQQKERNGLKIVMDISARGNLYLQDSKLDNALFTNNRPKADTVLSLATNLIYLLSALVYPFMPTTSAAIVKQLRAPHRRIPGDTELPWDGKDILGGHVINKPDYLFTKIEDSKEQELRQRYAGKQVKEETDAPRVAAASAKPQPPAKDAGKSAAKAGSKGKAPQKPSIKEAKPSQLVIADADKTPEMLQLEALYKEQGDKVRTLKGAKGAKDEETVAAVSELLRTKAQLEELFKAFTSPQ